MRMLIRNIGQLVTAQGSEPLRGEKMRLQVAEDVWMLIEGGRISQIGEESQGTPDIETVIDAERGVVLPGWVDAHTHPVFAGTRTGEYEMRALGATYQEIAASGGGIRSTVAQTRAASEEQLVRVGKKYAAWFLSHGTTTIEAKSGYGLTPQDELKILRAIRCLGQESPLRYIPTFLGAHAVPKEFSKEEYLQIVIEEMLPTVCDEGLAEFCDIFCEQNYFEADDARRLMKEAKRRGLGVRMHVDQLTDSGGAALAAELGAATADHLEQTSALGIAALVDSGVQPVLLPGSVYALGLKKYPDARAMIEAGLAVVLATDFNPGSSPSPSMPMTFSLACTQMKMTPDEAIVAATLNGACSLGRGTEIGTLEPGKVADFAIYDAQDYREIPYFFGINLIKRVYTAGNCAYTKC